MSKRFAGIIRDAREADIDRVQEIYAHYVHHALATFEEEPPATAEMAARRRKSIEAGLPYLVAEADGHVLGYAYAALYHARAAYRFTIEDSVYVADGLVGAGSAPRSCGT